MSIISFFVLNDPVQVAHTYDYPCFVQHLDQRQLLILYQQRWGKFACIHIDINLSDTSNISYP